ncbi:type I restriction endonuclease subunit R [Pseudorhodobacter turbinis]|uniref:Type I restriction enzyme endonuclease subunit n=1 Tax=Pseudorhodobacter turbinis TaxID=2500533 RepID=A0A4P8EH85_9RHOB|nr:type I restriction endonuclease subunit R [Pseudorhodobacter turbinis]QCO56296.1 type I restriction endonuclease subunit R [Pseudorhodobacter turbinis]
MTIQSEAQLETSLIERLKAKGWIPVRLADEAALWENLRSELGAHNGTTYSTAEFVKIRNHLEKGNVFAKAHTLRDRFQMTRDDGSSHYVQFMNAEHWCRNRYQVATQIGLTGRRKNRYDVTLLVNGLPLCQIELKRRGVELKAAFDQINRYQRDSFTAAGGLFQFVQVFVISNGVNTRYYANNRSQSFKQTFTWSDVDNKAINRLEPFADFFLEKCHLSKMIAKYVVLHESDQILMVLRPYQYYAVEAITARVEQGRDNGYVWHTTGSGKTLTSFKAAQNLCENPKVEKVLFVVDRADLDYQTTQEFNFFSPGSVDGTDDTRALVRQFNEPGRKLIITTIQKLNTAISSERFNAALQSIKDGRVVMIFDECHRSQFGEAHRKIREYFSRVQMFGFTGTPIFADNSVGRRTTADLFGKRLHTYVITDAIRDENVLRFSVEYMSTSPAIPSEDATARAEREKQLASREVMEDPRRIDKVVDWVIENHDRKTRQRQFGAMMCVGSVDGLMRYYDCFEAKRRAGAHDLKVATIFTYAANEADPEADDLIPETDFPTGNASPAQIPRRDKLVEYVTDYNARYGTNESVMDGGGFYTYYRALSKRMKFRDKKDFTPDAGIDILLVVNMFLTGFDAKTLNTLYVDKNLKFHGLIQAFSRTNRTLGQEKSQGNIVCFRDLKERTDEAIALFADKNARETILVGTYEEQLEKFTVAVHALLELTPTPDDVDDLPHEEAEAEFVKRFRELMRIRNVLASYSEFKPDDLAIESQAFEEFKSKYLDIAQKNKEQKEDKPSPLDDLDFELELIRRDDINVAYIVALLASLNASIHEGTVSNAKAKVQRKRIFDLLLSETQLRDKRDLISRFIDQTLPMLGPDDDVSAAFSAYWIKERDLAFARFCTTEHLEQTAFGNLFGQMIYTGKAPLGDEIVACMTEKPSILKRKATVERIITGMQNLLSVFDEGIGDISED